MTREAPTTVRIRSMPTIQSEETIQLTDLPIPFQYVVHTSMDTHPLSSSETTSPQSDADIQSEAGRVGDTVSPGTFHQWEMYPENLSNYDVLDVNINEYRRKLDKCIKSDSLIGVSTKVETLTMHCTNSSPDPENKHRFDKMEHQSPGEVQSFLEVTNDNLNLVNTPQQSISVFMCHPKSSEPMTISPKHSFARLPICKEALLKLLTYYSVLPQFTDVLLTFGQKRREIHENFPIYRQSQATASFFELCYNLKYIERREDLSEKGLFFFTTRKTGIWSRYSPTTNHTVSLLINPPERFKRRLEGMLGGGKACDGRRHYMDIHIMQLSCADENWAEYISELEEDVDALHEKVCSPDLAEEVQMNAKIPTLKDIQTVQLKREKLLELSNFLKMNQGVISLMISGFKRFQCKRNCGTRMNSTGGKADVEQMAAEDDFVASLEEHLMRASNHQQRALNLIRRCDGLNASVPSMLATRENYIMRSIQSEATTHSRSVRAMTVVALAYLPVTLSSTFFGADFLKPLSAYQRAIACVVAAIVLLIITFGVWRWTESRHRRASIDGASTTEVALKTA
ncbi:hypothetical protein K440DRAFT_657796 [Wilcoxina mikolae CBS 423.85]|nr:hypothetical protein K440DRAFT_657796 [Wilcoxina mikolae CBS 423.85]